MVTTWTRSTNLPKIRDYYTIDLLLSYEFNYHPPDAPAPAPKEGKDGKGGGGKEVASSKEERRMKCSRSSCLMG